MAARYELKRSGSQFMFNLIAGNGEKILTSERYTTKTATEGGIAACRVNAPHDGRYDRRTAQNTQYYFVLRAANNEVIGTSETYTSTQGMENGVASVKSNGPGAPIEDLS